MNKLMLLSLKRLFLCASIFFLLSSCNNIDSSPKEETSAKELSDKENTNGMDGNGEEKGEDKEEELPPPSAKEVGYAYGVLLAKAVHMNRLELDAGAVYAALMDNLGKGDLDIGDQEIILTRAFKEGKRKYAAENLVKQTEFLEKNKQESGIFSLESGVQYKLLKKGDENGKKAEKDSTIKVIYKGKALGASDDFDSSNGEAVELNMESVIEGWREVVPLMHVGDSFEVFIPSKLGYGEEGVNYRGQEIIPPNALLIFEMELVDVIEKKELNKGDEDKSQKPQSE